MSLISAIPANMEEQGANDKNNPKISKPKKAIQAHNSGELNQNSDITLRYPMHIFAQLWTLIILHCFACLPLVVVLYNAADILSV